MDIFNTKRVEGLESKLKALEVENDSLRKELNHAEGEIAKLIKMTGAN